MAIYVIVGILALFLFLILSEIFDLLAIVAGMFVLGAVGFAWIREKLK